MAWTGQDYSATLALNDDTLTQHREKHGTSEPDFIKGLGYGFDSVTESEARTLLSWCPAKSVRNRILAPSEPGGRVAGEGVSQGTPGAEGGELSHSLAPHSWEDHLAASHGQKTTNPETQETRAVSTPQRESGNQRGRTARGRRRLNDLHQHAQGEGGRSGLVKDEFGNLVDSAEADRGFLLDRVEQLQHTKSHGKQVWFEWKLRELPPRWILQPPHFMPGYHLSIPPGFKVTFSIVFGIPVPLVRRHSCLPDSHLPAAWAPSRLEPGGLRACF